MGIGCEKHFKYNKLRGMTGGGLCVNCMRQSMAIKNDPLMKDVQHCEACGREGHEGNGTILLIIAKNKKETFLCVGCATSKRKS